MSGSGLGPQSSPSCCSRPCPRPQCAVQVKLELGHRAQVRKKPTVEGFTHDWMVFVRGPEHSNIQHFVEKVVFHLHESFPRPKRVVCVVRFPVFPRLNAFLSSPREREGAAHPPGHTWDLLPGVVSSMEKVFPDLFKYACWLNSVIFILE
ncbi:Protein AF-9 [Fukomys damarensis]|uniref:Protein AF-9 n=1 Tax=Fukomys damarensis TaxID=885580 RepID=A0A091DJG2_FUKDA|nr:Protein AF-9 [Fukomys damarensis]